MSGSEKKGFTHTLVPRLRDSVGFRPPLNRKAKSHGWAFTEYGRKSKPMEGFTLIEIVTAAGLFIVVVVFLLNLFIVFSRAQRSAGTRQKIVSEISFIVEKMAQEIRTSEIIYQGNFTYNTTQASVYSEDGDSLISGKEVELALRNESNQEVYYFFDSGANIRADCRSGQGLYRFDKSIVTDCQKIFHLPNIEMVTAGFYIAPASNPHPDQDGDCGVNSVFNGYFCVCSVAADCYSNACTNKRCVLPNIQPRVTFSFKMRDLVNNKDIVIQTTSSGRVYKR